jgi:serine/threonine protein kinase
MRAAEFGLVKQVDKLARKVQALLVGQIECTFVTWADKLFAAIFKVLPQDADLDHVWKQDANGSTSPGDSCALSHFSRQVRVMHRITHVPSRMPNGHKSPQTDSTGKDPHYQVYQTTDQHRLPYGVKMFKVKVNKEYNTHVPGYNFSRNPESHVIELRAIRTLAHGTFGRVDAVKDPRFPGETFALKTFKQSSSSWSAKETFLRERNAMERLRPGHPHLINFLGSGSSDGRLCILMSPVADMDLARFLRDQSPGMISWGSITDMAAPATEGELFSSSQSGNLRTKWTTSCFEQMRGLASALSHIHEIKHRGKMMCHFDIKPSNILVVKGQHGWNFRLADFGCAAFVAPAASTEKSKPLPVTPMYCAPECYKHDTMMKPPGRSVDIWSLGCVFSEILTWALGIPIEDFENFRSPDHNDRAFCKTQDRVRLWLIKLRELATRKKSSLPYHSLLEMLSKMMSNTPDDRPTAKEVLLTFRNLGLNDTDRKRSTWSPKRTRIRLLVPLLINSQSAVDVVLDSGSVHNVISSSLASQLNLVIEPGQKNLPLFTLADGTEVRPSAAVELNCRFVEAPTKTFSSVFLVMDDIGVAVLGSQTLAQLQLLTTNRHLIEERTADTDSLPRCLQLSRTIPNMECNIASQPVFAILDTGSDIDLISHEYVLRRRLTLKRPSPGAQQVELANGKTVKITGRVKLKLKCDMLLPNIGHPLMKPHRVTFHVMPELTQDVLFGYDPFERLKMCLKKM